MLNIYRAQSERLTAFGAALVLVIFQNCQGCRNESKKMVANVRAFSSGNHWANTCREDDTSRCTVYVNIINIIIGNGSSIYRPMIHRFIQGFWNVQYCYILFIDLHCIQCNALNAYIGIFDTHCCTVCPKFDVIKFIEMQFKAFLDCV